MKSMISNTTDTKRGEMAKKKTIKQTLEEKNLKMLNPSSAKRRSFDKPDEKGFLSAEEYKGKMFKLKGLRSEAKQHRRASYQGTARKIYFNDIAPPLPRPKYRNQDRRYHAMIVQYGEKNPGKVQLNIQPFFTLAKDKENIYRPGKRTGFDLELLKWIRDNDIINQAIYLIETLDIPKEFK